MVKISTYLPESVSVVKQYLLHNKKTVFKNLMKWGPKKGILIFVDNDPKGYELLCWGSFSLDFFSFIHNDYSSFYVFISFSKWKVTSKVGYIVRIWNKNNVMVDGKQTMHQNFHYIKGSSNSFWSSKKPRYIISLVCLLVWSILVAELEHETNLLCNKT